MLRAEVTGSLRCGLETVGDIDIPVSAKKSAPVMDFFVKQDQVERILNHGSSKSSVRLEGGLQVDLRVVPP